MPGVRVFVVDRDDRVLLVKSDYAKSGPEGVFWVIPGGGIEPGEYSREAAVREVKEETGLDVNIKRLLWVVEEKKDDGRLNYTHYFLASIAGGELRTGYDPELAPDDQVILDVQFFSRDEINRLARVYPEAILEEFWERKDSAAVYDPWRSRPSKGFGIRS